MSTNQDITKKFLSATGGANCRTESENHPAHEEDTIDMISHHNERGGKRRVPSPKTEPEPDYDAEGMIPSN